MTQPCRRPTILLRLLAPVALLALDLAKDAISRRAASSSTCHGR